jgi:hypothetical protein
MKQLTNEERFFDYLAFDFAYKTSDTDPQLELPLTEDGELFLGFQALDQFTTTESPRDSPELGHTSPAALQASIPAVQALQQTSRRHTRSPTLAPAKQLFGFDAEIDEEYMRRAADGDDVYRGFESFFGETSVPMYHGSTESPLPQLVQANPTDQSAADSGEDEDLASFGWHIELDRAREARVRGTQPYPEAINVAVYSEPVPWQQPVAEYQPASYTSLKVLEDYPIYGDPESTLLLTYGYCSRWVKRER